MLTHLQRVRQSLKYRGQSATKSTLAGTACPCINSETLIPSREWHRDNPTAADCSGTGLISSTRTNLTIYAFIQEMDEEELEKLPPGLRNVATLKYFGAVDTSLNFVSVASMDEKRDYIVFDSLKYIVRNVDQQKFGDSVWYEEAILERRTD